LSERARVRRHYAPPCSTLVSAKSGSICIAVVINVSGGAIVLSSERLVGEVAAAEGVGPAGQEQHNTRHDTNTTTNDHTQIHPPPPHSQRSKVARGRRVAPPTPGWVAAPKSAWGVGSKSDAPWGTLGSGAPRPAYCARASLRRALAMRAMPPQRRRTSNHAGV